MVSRHHLAKMQRKIALPLSHLPIGNDKPGQEQGADAFGHLRRRRGEIDARCQQLGEGGITANQRIVIS